MNMDVQAIDQATGRGTAAGATAGAAPAGLPAFPDPHKLHEIKDETLHAALSQLVGGGAHVSVQFRVVGQHEIVTVFKNAETGEVITQFPQEAMVLIAQFFSKLAGAVVDRTA